MNKDWEVAEKIEFIESLIDISKGDNQYIWYCLEGMSEAIKDSRLTGELESRVDSLVSDLLNVLHQADLLRHAMNQIKQEISLLKKTPQQDTV